MNTEYLTAFRAFPLFFFGSYEMPYAESSDVLKIINHAHAVLGSIPFIQIFQPGTRKAVTTAAVLSSGVQYFLAVLDSTSDAGFRFDAVIASATGAWILIFYKSAAEAAVHSAGCDQLRRNCG